MRQEFRTFAHQVGTTPQEVTGGAHLGRIDIGLWEHAAAQQGGNLVRIDLGVFRFAAMDGVHLEGMPQHEGNVCCGTQVGEPIPGEDAFDGHDQPLAIRGNGLEERFGRRFHVAV